MLRINFYHIGTILIMFMLTLTNETMLFSQTINWNGQITGWMSGNINGDVDSQIGLRYIPDVFIEEGISDQFFLDADISINMYTSADLHDWEISQSSTKFKAYRLWVRLSGDRLETRLGLQKINFGSAILFRPLQWFDRIDPRDPLRITDGVYGLLVRYYFQNNTNIWLWGLYRNDESKGMEIAPTVQDDIEFGGRLQIPMPAGEAGISYHHRNADFSRLLLPTAKPTDGLSVPENRLGIDGKWDIGIGIWTEGVLSHYQTDIDGLKYQQAVTVGIDYTFDIGNGLTTIGEHFISALTEEFVGKGKRNNYSGFSANYPLGLFDKSSVIIYYDWDNNDWYRIINWQRIYDEWSFYLIGFWNPEESILAQNQGSNGVFTGKGLHIWVVYNH